MAVAFSGTKLPQSQLAEIQSEIYADFGTFRDRDIFIDEGHKSGTDVYESKVTVNMRAATTGEVTADGASTYEVDKSPVTNERIMFSLCWILVLKNQWQRERLTLFRLSSTTRFYNTLLQQYPREWSRVYLTELQQRKKLL